MNLTLSESTTDKKIMADFRPFQAWRYNTQKINPEKAIAPPYDVISPSEQDKLYQVSPYNCIRLILNKEEPTDTESQNRYTRARDFFNQWCAEGILAREKEPCFYLYRQVFTEPYSGRQKTRYALLGRLKLETFDKQIVIPHEKTLSKPRADRKKLLETTGTNFSPIFGLYEDPQRKVSSLYQQLEASQPLFEVPDEKGVRHALWPVSDPGQIQFIRQELSGKKIYIADGHHRYQTALDYSLEKRKREGIPADKEVPSDFVYMALVEFHDPGLVLYPTHRLVVNWQGFESAKALEALKEFFHVESIASAEALKESIRTDTGHALAFGLVLGEVQYRITLKDLKTASQKMTPGKPEVWYSLDVNIFSHLILAKLWNVPDSSWESILQYTQSYDEAVRRVKGREAQAAFLLKTPQVEILREMGKVQELMPQKSTYFFPKLASGLVFYQHKN